MSDCECERRGRCLLRTQADLATSTASAVRARIDPEIRKTKTKTVLCLKFQLLYLHSIKSNDIHLYCQPTCQTYLQHPCFTKHPSPRRHPSRPTIMSNARCNPQLPNPIFLLRLPCVILPVTDALYPARPIVVARPMAHSTLPEVAGTGSSAASSVADVGVEVVGGIWAGHYAAHGCYLLLLGEIYV